MDRGQRIEQFWRSSGAPAGTEAPPAWSFGDSPTLADELLALTLRGAKTAMASAQREFEVDGAPLPHTGDLAIVLDGGGEPRALIRTTEVEIVPFDEVTAEHARLEGEGDRSLAYWRTEHERAWRSSLANTPYEFDTRMPVVCERFELLFPVTR
ncbi:ASCH domain-containing protein [Microbacterium sp. NPDC057659]|uniref:ASCH domain-containing protein n=1 Tax=Microbacterium sp. NPDC057659 TaxID=3346198 RepID=UPI0036720B55